MFRLGADGLERTYQVEIDIVVGSLPPFLRHLLGHGEQSCRMVGGVGSTGPRDSREDHWDAGISSRHE